MTWLWRALAEILRELSRLGRPVAVVGGLAVSARTGPRFTRDVDLAVVVQDDRQAEALVRDLALQGYRPSALVEQDAVGRLATARLVAPIEGGTPLLVDLLFASSGIEREVVSAAESLEIFPGIHVHVAAVRIEEGYFLAGNHAEALVRDGGLGQLFPKTLPTRWAAGTIVAVIQIARVVGDDQPVQSYGSASLTGITDGIAEFPDVVCIG